MRIVLSQRFPLGRFHATPWRANVFDDPHGEWPPSPWRLTRSLVARWYQWQREIGSEALGTSLEPLVKALCSSTFSFRLPPNARYVTVLRTYQPADWGRQPGSVKQPGRMAYGRTLTRDNFWAVPSDGEILWFIEGDTWTPELCDVLDQCLARVAYFGRAESLTEIARVPDAEGQPNVALSTHAASQAATPVLAPAAEAALEDVVRTTDDPLARKRTVPAGARWMYTTPPARPPARRSATATCRFVARRDAVTMVQFAVGVAVAPEPRLVCRLTEQFRTRLLRVAGTERSRARGVDAPWRGWSAASPAVQDDLKLLLGKDASGQPLRGHRHLRLAIWFNGRRPARLIAWRDPEPFEDWELDALHRAALHDLSWSQPGGPSDWGVRLIPLDSEVPPPSGFSPADRFAAWESVTPYVPLLHPKRREESPRPQERIETQVVHELRQLGLLTDLDVRVEIGDASWAAVHLPPRQQRDRQQPARRRGFALRLAFSCPVTGPIAIGHSSHYGLGVFRPSSAEDGASQPSLADQPEFA